MSPITHFLTGWVAANCASLDRKERAIVALACVAPDIDGLGIIPELLTRNSTHPLLWFTLYHHALHTLAFAIVASATAFALAEQRWKTALLAFLHVPHTSVRRHPRLAGAGWLPMADSLLVALLLEAAINLEQPMGLECLAQRDDHSCAPSDHVVAGMVERLLADRDDFVQSERDFHRRFTSSLPQTRQGLGGAYFVNPMA